MNSSPITAMAKHQVDKPQLQSLLTQPKPQKEFADIFISTQTQATSASEDRARSSDHYERARRDERSESPRDAPEDRRADRAENGAERDKVEHKAVESDDGANSAPPQVDESTTGENVAVVSNGEEGVMATPAESEGGSGANTAAADDTEGQEGISGSGGKASADVVSITDDVDSELLSEGETPSAVTVDLSDKVGADAFVAGAFASSIVKTDTVGTSIAGGAKQSARTSGNIVVPTPPQQVQQGVDPSAQVIEVEQLLSDKPAAGAAIALKSTLDAGLKTDGVIVNNDMLTGHLASNLILSESRLTTKDALKDMLGAVKGAEAVNKQSAATPILPAGLDTKPLAPQTIQFQAAAARLPAGLQAAVGQPGWGQAVGERVLMMAAKNLQAAEIQLDPPELGQLQVRIVMNQDQASVSFVSPQQSVREALDESAQRLRDMFDAEGVELTDVDVSDQSQSGLAQGEHSGSSSENGADDEGSDEAVVQSVDMRLVDHYV